MPPALSRSVPSVALAAVLALLAGSDASAETAQEQVPAGTPEPAPATTPGAAAAPEPPSAPCSSPEASQFDFWLGEWDAAWGEDGRGSNVITRELGGCVVSEHFRGAGLEGRSWSVWVPALGIWKQTWVDDSGGYLDFTGGWKGDRMVLSREAPENPKATHQRMVFREIRPDAFLWDWESSSDGGESWVLRWHIRYTRRK
jgi:hypothetical protein